jgi:hypothetical protein
MLKRSPICPPIVKEDYNNNNLHQYDPYILKDDTIIIDHDWFESLTTYTKNMIIRKLNNNFKLEPVTVPHEIQTDNDKKMLKDVYQSYIDGFDYNIWYDPTIENMPQNVNMIKIPNTVKQILSDMFKGNKINDDTDLVLFKKEIEKYVVGDHVFIRLSGTSGKNEKSLRKLYNVDEIIKHLTSNKLFVFQEYDVDKDTYLIIIPWNKKIKPRNEFRLFIVNGKLTGASIQKWFMPIQHTSEELEAFEEVLSNIPFLNSFEYKTFVADVYVDVETKTCHLIEINPFGAHCGAGSSLFNWEKDYDMLHGLCDVVEFRYLSSINY